MSGLMEEFLKGSKVVVAQILYFRPLEEGRAPLKINHGLIGEKPTEIQHTNLLQTYFLQTDDTPDIKDERLTAVFESLVLARNGIVRIQDRKQRLAAMNFGQEDVAKGVVTPILIPKSSELSNPGMQEIVETFKTMIPFPKVRKFLQFWQENLDGPLHEVHFATGDIVKQKLNSPRAEYNLN